MFYYFPIEAYEERYSVYLSTPDGFWETFLENNKIEYTVFRPWEGVNRIPIGKGFVLDSGKRCTWAMAQIQAFIIQLDMGRVKDGDVLFLEDFWHPGFESLPYIRDMYKIKFKIYAWCHADSWDKTDFTYYMGMEPWKQWFEKGIAASLDGMFVADAGLKELIAEAGGDLCPIYAVGTCWNTDWIREKYDYYSLQNRSSIVAFASRWDEDKDPDFFMDLVRAVVKERPDISFEVTTGFEKLTSSNPRLVTEAHKLREKYPGNFYILENVSKVDYMSFLNTAKVHFNCAHHDWVSYALLESCAMGCMPLFPDYRSFPLALQFDLEHLYRKGNLEDAKKKLYRLIDRSSQKNMDYLFKRFDNAIPYVAQVMGLTPTV